MKKTPAVWNLIVLLFLLTACSKNNEEGGSTGNGTLKGIVYSPNGKVPLPSVKIEATGNDATKSVTSDKEGKFSLELPAGEYNVKMYAGAGNRLSLQKQFTVEGGKTQIIPPGQSSLTFSGKIAFIEGQFDDIQTLVTEMGIPVSAITAEQMNDYNNIKQYDVLLLNCGSEYLDFDNKRCLERFLQEGGSIYASDWELNKLSEQEWGFIPQDLLSYTNDGAAEITEGNVLFEPFKTALGKSKITIDFDQPAYIQIRHYATSDPRFKVLVDHPQKGPLALNIQWAPAKASSNGTPYGGNIIYTTFHDASLTADVKAVLRQMILAL